MSLFLLVNDYFLFFSILICFKLGHVHSIKWPCISHLSHSIKLRHLLKHLLLLQEVWLLAIINRLWRDRDLFYLFISFINKVLVELFFFRTYIFSMHNKLILKTIKIKLHLTFQQHSSNLYFSIKHQHSEELYRNQNHFDGIFKAVE